MPTHVSTDIVNSSGVTIRTGHFLETPSYRTIRPRGTADWLLVYTISGAGRFGRSGEDLAASPGTLTLTAPHVFHDYGTAFGSETWELLWVHFQPRIHWRDLLEWPRVDEGLMQLNIRESVYHDDIVAVFWNVLRVAIGGRPQRELFAMAALEELLLWCDLANPSSGRPSVDPRVASAIEYICSNLERELTVDDIAGHVICSPSRLSHLFKQQTGNSLQQFVENQRIERAKQLLVATDRSIQSISADIGYTSPFYFSLRFKRSTGESPSDYRGRVVAGE